ncbi:MAG: hypothetical protein ABSA03_05955, partial [Streptosporangiaceae bacterium]
MARRSVDFRDDSRNAGQARESAGSGRRERLRGVMGNRSWAAWLYAGVIALLAAALIAPAGFGSRGAHWWIELSVLRLLFLICDSTPTPLASRQSAWSPSSSATLAAVVLLGPA